MQRVREFYLEHSPESYQPSLVAKVLKVKANTVAQSCRRLVKDGDLERELYGFYRTTQMDVVRGIPWKRLKMHGIKIEFRDKEGKAPSFLWDPSRMTKSILGHWDHHIHRTNRSLVTHQDFEGRKVTISIHSRVKLIEVFVQAKGAEEAMTLLEFYGFCSYVQGLFPIIPLELWRVRQLAWNLDIHPLRIELVKSMSLQILKNVWMELYQKEKDLVRVGLHGTYEAPFDKVMELAKTMLRAGFDLTSEMEEVRT